MKKIGNFWFPDRENFALYINEIKEKNCFHLDRLNNGLKYVKKWNVAVDVGSNIGTWSIVMAKKFKKVYAFELVTETYECLVKNTEQYPNIVTFPYGLGREHKKVDILYDEKYPETLAGVCADLKNEGPYEVRTLDSFNLEGCDFLKIDVEGLEAHVLEGGANTITKYKPVIILEYKERKSAQAGTSTKDIDNMIEKLNYKKISGLKSDIVYGPK